MNDSRSKRRKDSKSKKAELQIRKLKAQRRRKGLGPNQEEAELASYLRRLFAFMVDQLIYIFFFFFYLIILSVILGKDIASNIGSITSVVIFGFIYFIPSLRKYGQTFGCKKAGIVVIDSSGEKYLSFSSSTIRWFTSICLPVLVSWLLIVIIPSENMLLVSSAIYILITLVTYAPILRTPYRQGIHDMISRSIVIKDIKF